MSPGLLDRAAAEVGAGADGLAGQGVDTHGHNSLQLSIALRTADAEDVEEEWELREPQVPPMDDDEWAAFLSEEAATVARAEAASATDATAPAQPGHSAFGNAAKSLTAMEDALKSLARDVQMINAKAGTPRESKIARLHAQMLRWRRSLRICDGKRQYPDEHPVFNSPDCAHVLGDAPALDKLVRDAVANSAPGAPRRQALREACRTRMLQATGKYDAAVSEGALDADRIRTRLLADINSAIADGRDPRWECFRAVGRAKAALAGKRTAPRLDRPGMRTIKRTGSETAETGKSAVLRAIHDESIHMHQERGASSAGALRLQELMANEGLPAPWPHTVHERREDAEVDATEAAQKRAARELEDAWTKWREGTATIMTDWRAQIPDGTHDDRDPRRAVHGAEYHPLAVSLRAEMARLMTDENIEKGLKRFRVRQGVGVGGFSGIWIARACAATKARYATLLREVAADVLIAADALERAHDDHARRIAIELIRQAAPPGWTQWVIMLLTKPGKALDVLSKRRDICLQPHSLKLCANAVAPHYANVQEHTQPVANTGFRMHGAATTTALWLGLTKEEAASERKGWYCGFIDKGGFFQSCVRRAQRIVEARYGVPVSVTNLIMAVHDALIVQYDSGSGLTHGTESNVGNGQGDTIAPMRSMLPLAIETRAVDWLVAGFQFVAPRGLARTRTPQGWFADDGALVVDSFRTLQQAFIVGSAMARVMGFTVGIDVDANGVPTGDKTGWMGSEWINGQWTEAQEDAEVRLIDGRSVPRVKEYYKHLGIRQTPRATWQEARHVVTNRCCGIASALSRLGILTAEEYVDTIDAATTTVVAYYGATFPIGRPACEKIDVAKRRGLARLGHAGERTSRWLAHAPRPQGLGMAMTWPHAAAALVAAMDLAIHMPTTAPAHVAVACRIAKEYWRLGWRPSESARVPLAWNPTWSVNDLTEDGIVEAWLLYLQTAGVRTRTGDNDDGAWDALADNYRLPDDPTGADAPIWERAGRTFGRRLARLGGTLRRHFSNGQGGWRSAQELGEFLGRGGRIVGGHRIKARLTPAEANEYHTLLGQLDPDEQAWAQAQRAGAPMRPAEIRAVDVLSAGRDRTGATEYLLRYSDGTTRWGSRPRAMAPGLPAKLREARATFLEQGERTLSDHVQDLVRHKRRLLEQVGEENEGDQFISGRARRVLGEPHAWWLASQAPLAVGARDPRKIIDDEARAKPYFQWTPEDEAETLTQARTAAQAALAKARRARQAMLDAGDGCASTLVELAEEAEAAWAWATTMQSQVALLEATDTQRPERQRAVERSYAEWITAGTRAARSARPGPIRWTPPPGPRPARARRPSRHGRARSRNTRKHGKATRKGPERQRKRTHARRQKGSDPARGRSASSALSHPRGRTGDDTWYRRWNSRSRNAGAHKRCPRTWPPPRLTTRIQTRG